MDINEVIKQIPFWKNLSDEEKKAILDRHSVKGKWGYIYKEDDKFYMAINFQTRFR